MQTITMTLKTNGCTGVWCDSYGYGVENPIITLGMQCRFRIALCRSDSEESDRLVPIPFEELQSASYYVALDSDYIQETTPKLLNVTGCTMEKDPATGGAVFCCEIPDTAIPDLITHIDKKKSGTLEMEIGGFVAGGNVAQFVFQTQLVVCNRIWLGRNPPSDVTDDPEYWNSAQVQAYLSQTPQVQTSEDGENWHDEVTENDRFWRWRIGLNGLWTKAFPIYRGKDGRPFTPDQIGVLSERPETAAAGFCYLASDTNLCYWYIGGAWSDGIPLGKDGTDGKSAYEIAVQNGYNGTEAEWLAYLKGKDGTDGKAGKNGTDGENAYQLAVRAGFAGTVTEWLETLKGKDGEDGAGIQPNATGTDLIELGAYADKPAGFIFAASVINSEEHYTDVYYYAKKTDDYNNWCNPLIKRFYGGKDGKDGENSKLIPPLAFTAPPDENNRILTVKTTAQKYPYAHISKVCIDTPDGELVLPYDTASGIEKMIKQSDGSIKIYFGTLVPEFETGKLYWAQASYPEGAFPDAPNDGNFYCRRNGQWIAVLVTPNGTVSITGTTEYVRSLTVGTEFSLIFDALASNGDEVSFQLASGSLPDGLSLSGRTLSGIPSTAGTHELTFTATAADASMEIHVSLNISAAQIMYYGFVPSTVEKYKVTDITADMLNESTVKTADVSVMDKTSLGNVPAGALAFVLIPESAGLTALKYDGIGGYTAFEENNGTSGTGANGAEVMISNTPYLVYGQFNLASSELFFKTQRS